MAGTHICCKQYVPTQRDEFVHDRMRNILPHFLCFWNSRCHGRGCSRLAHDNGDHSVAAFTASTVPSQRPPLEFLADRIDTSCVWKGLSQHHMEMQGSAKQPHRMKKPDDVQSWRTWPAAASLSELALQTAGKSVHLLGTYAVCDVSRSTGLTFGTIRESCIDSGG